MLTFIKFVWREYVKAIRMSKVSQEQQRILERLKLGTATQEDVRRWAILEGMRRDPYGDNERRLKKLNDERLGKGWEKKLEKLILKQMRKNELVRKKQLKDQKRSTH